WTRLPLYDWLRRAIHGIHFRSDVKFSRCCEVGGLITVKTGATRADDNTCTLFGSATRWVEPGVSRGMDDFVGLLVHEARHIEIGGHTCGAGDKTIDELGSTGVQYYYHRWLAQHTGLFLRPSDGRPPSTYRDLALATARSLCRTSFCTPSKVC